MPAMANSVPWRSRQLYSAGPKPMEKRSTLTPQRRATQKWPYSWMVTSSPSATTVASRVNNRSISASLDKLHRTDYACSTAIAQPLLGTFARLPVSQQHLGELGHRLGSETVKRVLDDNRDIGEANALVKEGLHRDFIGCVEDGAGGSPRIEGPTRQLQTGEPLRVRRLEVQPRRQQQIKRADAGIDPLRPGQGVGNGGAHVRVAQLSQHRAIDVIHQRMHHTLRMHHHLDLLGPGVEQPAGLDQLQPLVHHARRVDGYLLTHGPVGMGAGLRGGDLCQL